ncbi:extracellular catalytic domain type 2 short-chain-length polyhydroxyalkanoate depolymerase [Janthinobacterium sp. PSPC2-1]|uniref:extracellular catalytic domain type 2 short-chain-length polyhydroxyalkanoate depolymerase n=1 Tax=unclassified Janthinobacterium TaxID=2610881 RepID=UPI003CF4B331
MKIFFCTILLLLSQAFPASPRASERLPALAASQSQTSVSGLSAGAFMAVQYQVAYSGSVIGAGIVAGGPYYCAIGLAARTALCMGWMRPFEPGPQRMLHAAEDFATIGLIDPLDNLRHKRIYIFSGLNDKVVVPPLVDATAVFFRDAGVPAENMLYVKNVPAGHAMISPSYGGDCATNGGQYINHCEVDGAAYDQPGSILKHIYGDLNPPVRKRTDKAKSFNQREFSVGWTSLDADAHVYIPAICLREPGCRIHVAFHGCEQTQADVADAFYEKTGYNDWADSNKIIILYPQLRRVGILNPLGCWDWIGYTGLNYALRSGAQMSAVHAMLTRLMSAPN